MVTLKKATAALEEMGSPQAICQFFTLTGIKGKPGYTSLCPLAVYLAALLGREVTVGSFAIYTRERGESVKDEEIVVNDFPIVRQFVLGVDRREPPFASVIDGD